MRWLFLSTGRIRILNVGFFFLWGGGGRKTRETRERPLGARTRTRTGTINELNPHVLSKPKPWEVSTPTTVPFPLPKLQ